MELGQKLSITESHLPYPSGTRFGPRLEPNSLCGRAFSNKGTHFANISPAAEGYG